MIQKTNRKKILAVVGPTASGKSDLGIKLAKKLNGEIISADSKQVYRGMDIGTGKVPISYARLGRAYMKSRTPPFLQKSGVPRYKDILHYLIDVISPKKQFTASDFKKLGERAVEEITAKGKIPIIVGGTGFYVDVLLGRMNIAEVPPNPKLRANIEKQSIEKLYSKLLALGPERAKKIDRYNKHRLIRALEIAMATKKSASQESYLYHDRDININNKYEILWFGINPDKEELAKKIKSRLDARLKQGMIREVENLHKSGISWKKLDEFGLEYRWISRYLKNHKSQITNYKQIRNSKSKISNFENSEYYTGLLRDIIKYSKRQMTWFNKNKEIHWFKNSEEAMRKISSILND